MYDHDLCQCPFCRAQRGQPSEPRQHLDVLNRALIEGLAHDAIVTDDDTAADEVWIPGFDDLPEPEQDGWDR